MLSKFSDSEKAELPVETSKNYAASVAGRMAVKQLVSKYLQIDANNVVLHKNVLGKPYILYPEYTDLDISISHSGKYLAVAICKGGKVGIDIEKLRTIDISELVRFLTVDEMIYIYSAQNKDSLLQNFFTTWTLKESYVKAIGIGFMHGMPHINIEETGLNFSTIRNKEFVLSLCSDENITCNFLYEDLEVSKMSHY